MDPSNPPHVLHLIEAKLRAELERDTLRAEVERLTAELAARDAVGSGTPPDAVIIRNQGYTTIWWTSNPTRPGCGETMDDILARYPNATRENLWRHPPKTPAQDVDVVTVPRDLVDEIVGRHDAAKELLANEPDDLGTDDADPMEVTQWSNELGYQQDKLNEALDRLSALRAAPTTDSQKEI